jgi:hypothetical protein
MLPDEVREAMERAALMAGRDGDWVEIDDADWQTIRAHLLAREADAEMLAFIASGCGVAVNKWLVQVIHDGKWQTAYFANPPGGPAAKVHPSKLDALRACITAHLSENSRDA